MKRKSLALIAAVWLSGTGLTCAAANTNEADRQGVVGGHVTAAQGGAEAKPKPVAANNLVDINTATSKELKNLPGINGALAAKIIAGRPYGSKAQLVSHNIIDLETYDKLSRLIVARQTSKTVPRTAASAPVTK